MKVFMDISYNNIEKKPKLIIAGGSAYSRIIDFKKFREIADKINAYLMVDMAHFSGLVAGKGYPNPIDFADIVTSTTHKVLRGGRGGIILTNKEDIIKKINSAVFPGYQGGPLMHVIAAKAVTFQEALQPSFKNYIKSVLENAKILSETLKNNGFKIFSGGTDTHLMLVDLRPFKVTGKDAQTSLCKANITCNKNGIPFDGAKPTITSGIRLGSQAATTRGFGLNEFKKVGELITKVIEGLSKKPITVLVDGKFKPKTNLPTHSIIKGDTQSLSIAASSIIAKVYRDNLMRDFSKKYPEYLWEKNAGYGTKEHLLAIKKYGITPIHRKSFKPIYNMLN